MALKSFDNIGDGDVSFGIDNDDSDITNLLSPRSLRASKLLLKAVLWLFRRYRKPVGFIEGCDWGTKVQAHTIFIVEVCR